MHDTDNGFATELETLRSRMTRDQTLVETVCQQAAIHAGAVDLCHRLLDHVEQGTSRLLTRVTQMLPAHEQKQAIPRPRGQRVPEWEADHYEGHADSWRHFLNGIEQREAAE